MQAPDPTTLSPSRSAGSPTPPRTTLRETRSSPWAGSPTPPRTTLRESRSSPWGPERVAVKVSTAAARRLNSNADFQACISPIQHKNNSITNEKQKDVRVLQGGLQRSNAIHTSMTLNKLRFSSLGLYGRDREIATLSKCVDRVLAAAAEAERDNEEKGEEVVTVFRRAPGRLASCISDRNLVRQKSFKRDYSRQTLSVGGQYDSIASFSTMPAVTNERSRQLILISGYSGTGKTSLAGTVEKKVWNVGGIYARGKCDLSLKNEPYTGLAAACGEVCDHIKERIWNPEKKTCKIKASVSTRIVKDIIAELGDELFILSRVIPKLDDLVQHHNRHNGHKRSFDDDDTSTTLDHTQSYEGAQNRFNFAFRRFIRILSTYFKPLVFVLDDLQWADLETLSLLQVLMTDQSNPNFMVIGCYRSNEQNQSQILPSLIGTLRTQANEGKVFDMTEIEIGNLTVDQVNRIVMDLTSIDDPFQTLGLAKICHEKTLGNAFFAVYFLSMLSEHRLLSYNFGMMKWVWDEKEIEDRTKATTNVVDIMKDRMAHTLSPGYKRLMEVGACLGATFDSRLLTTVWHDFVANDPMAQYGDVVHTSRNIDKMLSFFVQEGYLHHVSTSPGTYRWVHDRLQEACFASLPEEEINSLKYYVGSSLLRNLGRNDANNEIFVVVNLLNSGASTDAGQMDAAQHPTRLAKLNLQAARNAVALSAFRSASKYATTGIDMLPADKWQCHYKLTVDLYSTAAEIECHLGHSDDMQKHCDAVLQLSTPCWSDKLRVYNVLVDSMYNRGDHNDAIDLCLDCLGKLGCSLPKTELKTLSQTAAGLNKAKKNARKTSDTIDALPPMTDRLKIDAMELLDKLARFTYFSHHNLLPVVVFKMLKWTLEYGLCVSSPTAFAATALVFAGRIYDFDQAEVYAKLALRVLEKLRAQSPHNARLVESRTKFILHSFVFHWFKPYHEMSKPLLEAYENGMQSGDGDSAIWAVCHYLVFGFQAGRALEQLQHDTLVYIKQGDELNRGQTVVCMVLLRQACLNLMGMSQNPIELTGESIDQNEVTNVALMTMNRSLLCWILALQSLLYAFFGEHELGAELALSKGDTQEKVLVGSSLIAHDVFYRGISLFEMARKTKNRRYKKEAKKTRSCVKSWLAKGNPNMKHIDAALLAESAALDGKDQQARRHYEKAVVAAARAGFVHHAALISERYGDYLFQELSCPDDASFQFENATKFYSSWGAFAKVDILRQKKRTCRLLEQPKGRFRRGLGSG